MDHTCI